MHTMVATLKSVCTVGFRSYFNFIKHKKNKTLQEPVSNQNVLFISHGKGQNGNRVESYINGEVVGLLFKHLKLSLYVCELRWLF